MHIDITEKKAWEIISPVCRELVDLVDSGHITFVSGIYMEKENMYKIFLQSDKLHFASRGLKDNIGDIEYKDGKLRIGLRANSIPLNIFVEIKKRQE